MVLELGFAIVDVEATSAVGGRSFMAIYLIKNGYRRRFILPSIRPPVRLPTAHQSCSIKHRRRGGARYDHASIPSVMLTLSVGGSISGPVVGRIVDSRGTRIPFVCAFLCLLGGYSGIRYIFDKGIPEDATSLSMFSFSLLILFGFMTGAGNSCGITSALNTIAKTFPDRMVCCMSCHVSQPFSLLLL